MLKSEHITERAELLLSSLILLHRSEGKQMKVGPFKNSLSAIKSAGRVYECLLKNKIITSTGNPRDGWKVQYCTEVSPNLEMAKKVIQCSTKHNQSKAKKVVKQLPHTLYEKREFTPVKNENPQDTFTKQITALKESFEKQYDAKVEILVEVIMTTTVQI